jgi:UDP-galactopyranose mutase
MRVDWVVVGAGFSGCVLAERLASQLDQKVLLVDKRDHVGGNAFDYHDENGILVHKYGPHIFHTNGKRIFDYLSKFTEWRPYHHHVLGVVDGKKVPIPFNLNSLYQLFPQKYAERLEEQLIEAFGFNVKVPILKLKEAASGDLKFLADYIYQNVFHGYTMKMWELKPEELAPSVTARVPVYISRDDRYFQDTYQAMPLFGYSEMFRRMLKHPNIMVLTNADYREIVEEIKFKKMAYTGQIDAYFDYMHGELPYRSLDFKFVTHNAEKVLEAGTVNYPNDYDFTRMTEQKTLTGQTDLKKSTLIVEYPKAYEREVNDPYYPIPRDENKELYEKYAREATKLKGHVFFAGRLADYQYYNMDQVVGRALACFEKEIVADADLTKSARLMPGGAANLGGTSDLEIKN